MQFDFANLKSASVAGYHALFGGRIARTTFAIRAAILIAVVVILVVPLSTILAPSSKTLRDAYLALSFCVFGLCLIGIVSAYVKRLHDMGLRGYWALAFLIILPMAMSGVSTLYISHVINSDPSFDTSELGRLIVYVVLILPFLIALWRGEKAENRFGPVPDPVEHVGASKFNIAAVIGAAAILIPTSIYAGLFQSGVWVGRGDMAPRMPFMDSNVSGTRFMKCWNVKGVGAGSGEGAISGVYRDGYAGNVFDFLVTPTGQIDIAMAGERGGDSFLAEGFRIVPYGLKLPVDGSGHINVQDLDRFMLVAIFDQGGPGGVVNYTTFTFGRNKDKWPEYQVVMTSALSSSANATDLAKFPEARGRLMIGDCVPY